MKKALLVILILILACAAVGYTLWQRRASVAASFMHRHLGVPVTLQALNINANGATLTNLQVSNPSGFQSPFAFQAEDIIITTTLAEIRANPLTIDEIDITDIMVNVESKRNGETNWHRILAHKDKSGQNQRHYLIKTLILRNLNVQLTKPDGSTQNFPLGEMQFHNISDETGFPVSEIEKAIFNQVMKQIFQQLNLPKQLLPLVPGGKYVLPFLP